MTVTSSTVDHGALTFTIVAEFDSPIDRVWQVWSDPRQLERWWGPPGWPATFSRHDFETGGESRYVMTGPEGQTAGGWWRITRLHPPTSVTWDDGFSDDHGEPEATLPVTHSEATLEPRGAGTVMTLVSRFDSLEQLQQLIAMGMQEGLRLAVEQIDDLVRSGD